MVFLLPWGCPQAACWKRKTASCRTWEDVDFQRSVIMLPAAYTKNGESRSVPMNKVLTKMLQAVRITVSTTGPVFCSR